MELAVQDKKIAVYGGGDKEGPVVYLNTVHGEGRSVWEACLAAQCRPFTLAAISGLNWDHDMSPWAIPPIAPGDTPCTGGADEYLQLLTREIVPAVEREAGLRPRFRALAGYSLAGLFGIYAAYHTAMFPRIASASGSLWFPGFCGYVRGHELKARLDRLYLSLGDLESRTDNRYLAPVQENTEEIAAYMKSLGINTTFELNPGNHFRSPNERMAKGIAWILNDSEDREK